MKTNANPEDDLYVAADSPWGRETPVVGDFVIRELVDLSRHCSDEIAFKIYTWMYENINHNTKLVGDGK